MYFHIEFREPGPVKHLPFIVCLIMGIVTGSIFVIIGYLSGTPFGMCLGSILGMGAMGSIILMGMEVLDI